MAGSFVRRYRDDTSEPTKRSVARDIAIRGLLPALALLAIVYLVGGFALPREGVGNESVVNQQLQAGLTPTLDLLALAASQLFGAIGAPLIAVVAVVVLWLTTRQWWLALVPLVAVALEALVYQTAALLVARARPEGVEQMDFGLPEASFPSGHVGATVCLMAVFTLLALASDKPRWVPVAWAVAGVVAVVCVGASRLYLGMHHVSDLVAGLLIGLISAVIGWLVIRRHPGRGAAS